MRTKEAGRNAKPVLSLRGSHSLPGWCAGMEKRRPPSIRKDDAKQCCLLPIALPPLIEKAPEPSLRGFFSIAGHQRGADEGSETRSSLMWETIHIIDQMGEWKPKYVIWENVKKGLLWCGLRAAPGGPFLHSPRLLAGEALL